MRSKYFHPCFAHQKVLQYVSSHPGCCKFDAAKAGTRDYRRNPSHQYYLVNTLIRHGMIKAEKKHNGTYSLTVVE